MAQLTGDGEIGRIGASALKNVEGVSKLETENVITQSVNTKVLTVSEIQKNLKSATYHHATVLSVLNFSFIGGEQV